MPLNAKKHISVKINTSTLYHLWISPFNPLNPIFSVWSSFTLTTFNHPRKKSPLEVFLVACKRWVHDKKYQVRRKHPLIRFTSHHPFPLFLFSGKECLFWGQKKYQKSFHAVNHSSFIRSIHSSILDADHHNPVSLSPPPLVIHNQHLMRQHEVQKRRNRNDEWIQSVYRKKNVT